MAVPRGRAAVVAGRWMAEVEAPLLSIVVPFRNEIETLRACHKGRFPPHPNVEWVFVDGGSSDGSTEYLRQHWLTGAESNRLKLVSSEPGRAAQMNTGARQASGTYLMFLHIDTRLPDHFERWLTELATRRPLWGFFSLRLDGSRSAFRLIERMISWRSSLDHLATGDQAQFVARESFTELGGFPDLPIMEDRELSRLLRARASPWVVDDAVISSSRRWEQHGIWRTVLLMWVMKWRWRMGACPYDLARCYRSNRLF